jgi:hypothetical protein
MHGYCFSRWGTRWSISFPKQFGLCTGQESMIVEKMHFISIEDVRTFQAKHSLRNVCRSVIRWVCSSGGNLEEGEGRPPTPPPHLHGKLINFRKFWSKRGLKTVFSSANGKVCRKFESLVGNLGGFALPPPPPPTGKSEFPPLVCSFIFV